MKPTSICLLLSCLALSPAALLAAGNEYGLYFGGGGTLEVPPIKMPAGTGQLTVELRFKPFAAPTQPVRLLSLWADDARVEDKGLFHFDLIQSNRIAFSLRSETGQVETVAGKEACEADKWHHAAATWDGSTLTLYLDGEAIGSRQPAGFKIPASSSLPLILGPAPAKSVRKPVLYRGFLGEVAVWSTARTAEAIAQSVEKPLPDTEPELVARVALRVPAPADAVKEQVAQADVSLPVTLARTGWCPTPMWAQPPPEQPYLHLFGYNLSAPAGEGGAETPILKEPARQILVHNAKTQQPGVLWQDKKSGAIYVTWVAADLTGHETIRLKSMDDGILAAGTSDPAGNVCYLEIQKAPPDRDASVALHAAIHAAAADGKPLFERPLDMSNAAGGFNVFGYGGRWGGSMAYSNGALGLILPRTMYKSGDGLNHQAAIAVAFSARDPAVFKNLGQITSHSFGNLVTVNSRGEFLGLDLGDCYPRGVHLHKFTPAGKTSRLVFTFKTAHATGPRNNSPVYEQISGGGKTFYKWSNDNNTYTELGGAVEGQVSYSVIFSTDRSLEGRVLDNSRAFGGCDDPRDLAMIRVIKEFDRVPGGIDRGDAILAGIPEGSKAESGGFFNFGGSWSAQRVNGVIWLTSHKKGEAAHAPQPLRLRDGTILILWEKTGPDGPAVCGTRVAEVGKVLGEWIGPGLDLRFSREDHVVALGERIFLLATDQPTGTTRLCFVDGDSYGTARTGKVPAARKSRR